MDELGMLADSCYRSDTHAVDTKAADEPLKLDPDYQQLIDFIGFDSTSIDQLVNSSGLTPAEVSSMLLQLEMSGYIASNHGGTYNRLK
jgi:DNA processing protein